jgi:hypothetical protein
MNRRCREPLLVILASTIYALLFTYPILGRLWRIGFFDDWDYSWQLAWVQVHTIAYFHQLPLWNPYKCGGMQLLGNPQARILTPFFLLHLLLGPVAGLHLEIILHLAIAVSGAYFLARVLGLAPMAAVACGAVFAGSSWFFLHMAAGHAVFLPSSYLPWIVALFWTALKTNKLYVLGAAAALLALVFFEGGVYFVTHTLVVISILAAVVALETRTLRPLLFVVMLCALASGIAAIKILPSYYMSLRFPRDVSYISESHSLVTLFSAMFSRVQDPALRVSKTGTDYAFWEIGAYISPWSIPLIILGCVGLRRDTIPWAVCGFVLVMLSMGNFSAYAPWSLLQHLPVFSSERVVSRFLIPFTLVTAVMSAFGVEFICARSRLAASIIPAYLAILICDMFLVSPPILAHMFDGDEQPVAHTGGQFRQVAGDYVRFLMYPLAKANQGAASCYEYSEPGTPVRGYEQHGYRGEYYLTGPGLLTMRRWTPNALSFDLTTASANVIVINQNYDEGWRLIRGQGEVFSYDGLLGVHVPAGVQHLGLRYRSYPFLIGAAITLLTCAGVLGLWVSDRRKRAY